MQCKLCISQENVRVGVQGLSVGGTYILLKALLLLTINTIYATIRLLARGVATIQYIFLFDLFILLYIVYFITLVHQGLIQFSSTFYNRVSSVLSRGVRPGRAIRRRGLFCGVGCQLKQLCRIVRRGGGDVTGRQTSLRRLVSSVSRRIGAPVTGLGVVGGALLRGRIPPRGRGRFLATRTDRLSGLSFLVRTVVGASHLRAKIVSLRRGRRPICSALTTTLNKVLLGTRGGRVSIRIRYPRRLSTHRSEG